MIKSIYANELLPVNSLDFLFSAKKSFLTSFLIRFLLIWNFHSTNNLTEGFVIKELKNVHSLDSPPPLHAPSAVLTSARDQCYSPLPRHHPPPPPPLNLLCVTALSQDFQDFPATEASFTTLPQIQLEPLKNWFWRRADNRRLSCVHRQLMYTAQTSSGHPARPCCQETRKRTAFSKTCYQYSLLPETRKMHCHYIYKSWLQVDLGGTRQPFLLAQGGIQMTLIQPGKVPYNSRKGLLPKKNGKMWEF